MMTFLVLVTSFLSVLHAELSKQTYTDATKITVKYPTAYKSPTLVDATLDCYFSPSYFTNSAKKYNPSLSLMSLGVALSAFNSASASSYATASQNVKQLLQDIGCDNIKINSQYSLVPEAHEVAYALGRLKVTVDSAERNVIVVAIRGGNYGAEWADNAFIGDFGYHAGFSKQASTIIAGLRTYIKDTQSEDNVKIWVCGFGRAGAIAGIVGLKIADGDLGEDITTTKDDTYVYTFGAPPSVNVAKYTYSTEGKSNIHNYVNPRDIATYLPFINADFYRPGYSYSINLLTRYDDKSFSMSSVFRIISSLEATSEITEDTFPFAIHNSFADISLRDDRIGSDASIQELLERLTVSMRLFLYRSRDTYVNYSQTVVQNVFEHFGIGASQLLVSKFLNTFVTEVSKEDLLTSASTDSAEWQSALITAFTVSGIPAPSGTILSSMANLCTRHAHASKLMATILKTVARTWNTLAFQHSPEMYFSHLALCDPTYHHFSQQGGISGQANEESPYIDIEEFIYNDEYRSVQIGAGVYLNIYDSTSTLVASLQDGSFDSISANSPECEFDFDGESVIYLPSTESYTIQLLSPSDAETKVYVSIMECSDSNRDALATVLFSDVTVTSSTPAIVTFPQVISIDGDAGTVTRTPATYSLRDSAGATVGPKYSVTGPENKRYTVAAETSDPALGAVIGAGVRPEGTRACVYAIPTASNALFGGWYNSESTLLSSQTDYCFKPTADIALTAKFKTPDVPAVKDEGNYRTAFIVFMILFIIFFVAFVFVLISKICC